MEGGLGGAGPKKGGGGGRGRGMKLDLETLVASFSFRSRKVSASCHAIQVKAGMQLGKTIAQQCHT